MASSMASPPPFPGPPPEWQAVLDACADLLALVEGQGRVLWVNASLLSASGHPAEAVLGHALEATLAPPQGWPGFAQQLRDDPAADAFHLPWRDAQGQARSAQASVRRLPGLDPALRLVQLRD